MTGFRWTGLEIGTLAIIGATLAAMVWMQWEKHRDEREITEAAEKSAALTTARRIVGEAQRIVDAAARSEVETLIAVAEYFCRFAAHEQGLSLLADLAERHPMPKRPAPPPAAPGEPWQQHVKNNTEPGLMGPGVPETETLGGEQ